MTKGYNTLLQAGEDFGMESTKFGDVSDKDTSSNFYVPPKDQIIRTSKRTNGWSNEALSIKVNRNKYERY